MQNILDLCRLNLMEENIINASAMDRNETLKAIEWKRRQIIVKIKPLEIDPEAMKRHLEDILEDESE